MTFARPHLYGTSDRGQTQHNRDISTGIRRAPDDATHALASSGSDRRGPSQALPPDRRRHIQTQLSCALRSTARNSTSAPAAAHSGVIASASLWLNPSTHGTKIIPVGATRAT